MKPIYTLILTLLYTTSFALANEKPRIAQVDYSEINSLLEQIILKKPENKKLAERYLDKQKKNKEHQDKMQKAIFSGEKFNPMEMAEALMDNTSSREDDKKVEQQCAKYLIAIIEKKFKDDYDVILKKEYRSNLLYTQIPIEDITEILRQELLKEIPEASTEASK